MSEATEKNFRWLCDTLVSAGVQVPIVETVFIQRGEVALWVYSTKSGKVKKRTPFQPFENSLPLVLRHFQNHLNWTSPDPVCTVLISGHRTPVTLTEGQAPPLELLNSTLQEVLADLPNPHVYVLRLDREHDSYSSSFSVKLGETVRVAKSLRQWCKCSAIGKVALRAVERARKGVVVSVELELVVTALGDVLLYGCPTIIVQGDLQDLEIAVDLKHRLELPSDSKRRVQIKQGPCRIPTPASVYHSPLVSTKEPVQTVSEATVSYTTLPKICDSHLSPDFYNPHFKEIVALTYARTRPHLFKANIDEIFSDMNRDYLQDTESSSRPKAVLIPVRRSRLLTKATPLKSGFAPNSSFLDLNTTTSLKPTSKKNCRLASIKLGNGEAKGHLTMPLPSESLVELQKSRKVLLPARLRDYCRQTII